jgi:CO/xanthine dehydrogenase Mo-binding subunit
MQMPESGGSSGGRSRHRLVEIVQYTSIDDCGRAVNPMLVHGQSHGGIA